MGILNRLKQERKITSQQYDDLYPTQNIPRLYCTPKIHKTGAPLRPIVDYIGPIGYNTSKTLADILTPMQDRTPRQKLQAPSRLHERLHHRR